MLTSQKIIVHGVSIYKLQVFYARMMTLESSFFLFQLSRGEIEGTLNTIKNYIHDSKELELKFDRVFCNLSKA